jgi:hypothetical protein
MEKNTETTPEEIIFLEGSDETPQQTEVDISTFLDDGEPQPVKINSDAGSIDLSNPEREPEANKEREYNPPKETVKQVRAVSSATSKTFSWLLNYIVPSLCSAISGEDKEKYKMPDKDAKEYEELCSYYFEATGNLPSPSIIFYIATAAFVGGAFIKSFSDRKKRNLLTQQKLIVRKPAGQKTAQVEPLSFAETLQRTPVKRTRKTATGKTIGRPKKIVE